MDKIISGGQTGVDRAALDVALHLGIPCGGSCPEGRKAEDGRIPARYPLTEMNSPNYPVRTRKNVKDADGTLILAWGAPMGGTLLTIRLAKECKKPYFIVDLHEDCPSTSGKVLEWGKVNHIKVLNIAGPRESEAPGIYNKAFIFLKEVLTPLYPPLS